MVASALAWLDRAFEEFWMLSECFMTEGRGEGKMEEKVEAWTAPARPASVITIDKAMMTLGHSKLGLWFLIFAHG